MDKDILDTFYNYVLPGVLNGEVDCGPLLHVLFNVTIGTKQLLATNKYEIEDIPTLYIADKNVFNSVIIDYVKIALPFYEGTYKYIDDDKKIAYILTLAFVSMGEKDYLNPEYYFFKLTKSMEIVPIELDEDYKNYGHSDILDSDVLIKVSKEKPNEEAPFKFQIKINNGEETYSLQTIRFYILENKVYIGAIQHEEPLNISKKSKIKRKLFKANESVDLNSEMINTNPGLVVAFSTFMSYINSHGFYHIVTLPPNIQREIDKKILSYKLSEKIIANEYEGEKKHHIVNIIERSNCYPERIETVHRHLKNGLARFAYHFNGTSYFPKNNDNEDEVIVENITDCNNKLLKELYIQVSEQQKKLT